VITPFRPGYFGAPIKGLRGEAGLHAHVQALSEFLYVFGLVQAPIAAHASGALHLAMLLSSGARLSGPVILSSPTYLPDGNFERVSRHFRVAVNTARTRPKLAQALFGLALSTLRASSHWQNAFAQYMGWSSDDMARHETMLSQRAAYALNAEMFRLNLPGFVNDIGLTATDWPALDHVKTAPTLLFGDQETVTDLDEIRRHPGLEAARIEILPGAGRSAALLDPGLLFDLLFPEPGAPEGPR
jgi:hypothetical protein